MFAEEDGFEEAGVERIIVNGFVLRIQCSVPKCCDSFKEPVCAFWMLWTKFDVCLWDLRLSGSTLTILCYWC